MLNALNKDTVMRAMDFASTVRNKTDSQVIEMIKSNEVRRYGLDESVADMILASRLHCKPEEVKNYRNR